MPSWAVGTLAGALAVSSFALSIVLEKHMAQWFLRRGRDRPGRTALWAVGAQLGWCALWAAVAALSSALMASGAAHSTLGWLVCPAILACASYQVCCLPGAWPGRHIDDLVREGASRTTARAFFLVNAPFAVLLLVICIVSFLAVFVP